MKALSGMAAGITGGSTVADYYRICVRDDQSPQELDRIVDTTIIFKATDIRSGEPVAVQLIPTESIDPAAREQFENQARAAQLLDHINIAKIFAFQIESDHFVVVSEYLDGETLDSWTTENGPMPLDAVLEIALQVVSAVNAASFHRLVHCAIQPSNIIIVPGATADGGWPFVKLINFGLAGFGLDLHRGVKRETRFASPEELSDGTVDFRSEIFSLGATMCFLLTGAMPVPALTQFPKKLRNLLAGMLRDNPDERPQDPVGFAEEIRGSLLRVERRQALARRFALPLRSTTSKISERPLFSALRLSRKTLAVTALVITATVLAAILLAQPVRTILHRNRSAKPIGIVIGVSDGANSMKSAPVQTPMPVARAAERSENPSASAENSIPKQKPPPAPVAKAEADVASRQAASEPGTNEKNQADSSKTTVPKERTGAQSEVSTQQRSSGKVKQQRVASESRKELGKFAHRPHRTRGRARLVGVTPDGGWVLRLPSGETVVVAPSPYRYPPYESAPRRVRRIPIERDETLPPPYWSTFPPDG